MKPVHYISRIFHGAWQRLLIQLLFLSFATQIVCVSLSGEMVNPSSLSGSNAQQKQQQKVGTPDPHLNSLTVYATNYDAISNDYSQQQQEFKPSYKLPEMETNFTPIQKGVVAQPPTPVLMHYLPQSPQDGDKMNLHYLQLIPTRPLIVPISAYMPQAQQSAAYPSQPLLATNTIDYAASHSNPLITSVSSNNAHPPSSGFVSIAPNLSYGLPTNGNSIQPYRHPYRINREVKHLPPSMSLNMNEYLPGSHEGNHHIYVRGRP